MHLYIFSCCFYIRLTFCLLLSYYVRIKLRSISWLHISLGLCSITDAGLEAFCNEMSKGINNVTRGKLHLSLTGNPIITDRANRSITTLLSSGIITNFDLNASIFPGTVSTTLKCIINGLNYSSLEYLSLTGSHINVTHLHYLILLVRMSSNLHTLYLSDNDLNLAIPLFSSAIIHHWNKT